MRPEPSSGKQGPRLRGLAKRIGTRSFAAGYQAGLEAVAALAVATLAGAWVDYRFGTAPIFLLLGSLIGFGSCTLRLWRYQKARDDEARGKRDESQ